MKRFKKFLTLIAASAALSASSLAAAAPAQAATSTSFCFRWAEGSAYAGYPVYLYSVDSSGRAVSQLRAGKTAANGCGTFFNTPSTVSLRVYAGIAAGGHYWSGVTPYWATPGTGGANLGTGYLYQQW